MVIETNIYGSLLGETTCHTQAVAQKCPETPMG
jgi:hypothetical protein